MKYLLDFMLLLVLFLSLCNWVNCTNGGSFISSGRINSTTCSTTPAGVRHAMTRQGHSFLLFLHPHKAGGTSLCRILLAQPNIHVGPNQNCNPIINGRVWNSIPMQHDLQSLALHRRRQKYNFLASEYKPMPPSFKLSSPMFYQQQGAKLWTLITILRHPVDRVISHFNFENLHVAHSSVLNWALTAPYHSQNYYVRLFSGHFPPGASLDPHHRWTDYDIREPIPPFWKASTANPMIMTEQDLVRAKNALEHFAVVLLVDRMDESLGLLTTLLHMNMDISTARHDNKHKNKKKQQRNMTHEEYGTLLSLNHLDMALFKFANDLMDCNLKLNHYS
jgi:hypothetical protein